MTIADFDHLTKSEKKDLLQKCCGSLAWVNNMLNIFPVNDLIDLLDYADDEWKKCKKEDWIDALAKDPATGDSQSLTEKYAASEHSGTNVVSTQVQRSLFELSKLYRQKFGYPFIESSSQKSEGEMLETLSARLNNTAEAEIEIAAAEQIRIIKDRLTKMFV